MPPLGPDARAVLRSCCAQEEGPSAGKRAGRKRKAPGATAPAPSSKATAGEAGVKFSRKGRKEEVRWWWGVRVVVRKNDTRTWAHVCSCVLLCCGCGRVGPSWESTAWGRGTSLDLPSSLAATCRA